MTCIICGQREPRTPSLACGACYAYLRATLAAVAWAHSWLRTRMYTLTPAWKPATTHAAPTTTRPPFAVELHDTRTDIATTLNKWAGIVGYWHEPPIPGPADHTVPTVARWLTDRLGWLLEQDPWADLDVHQLLDTLAQLHRDAYALAPWESCRRDLPLPCPACEQLTLSVYGGDDAVICRDPDCARTVGWAEYQDAVRTWSNMVTRKAA